MIIGIQLGSWRTHLCFYIDNAEKLVNHFKDSIPDFVVEGNSFAKNYLVVLCAKDGIVNLSRPSFLSQDQSYLWEEFSSALVVSHRHFCQSNALKKKEIPDEFTFAWSQPEDSDRRNKDKQKELIRFYALVLNQFDENSFVIILGYVLFLAIRWHIERSELCIHSSAVVRERDGYLFLGKSEAGKTTVAQLSASLGYTPLGDDLNFILNDGTGYRIAPAPSLGSLPAKYSMLYPPLRGLFTLVQDSHEALLSLHPMQVANVLFTALLQETPHVQKMSPDVIRHGFRICCDIARRVPGYELHFRKSPDFWKLINEQFSA